MSFPLWDDPPELVEVPYGEVLPADGSIIVEPNGIRINPDWIFVPSEINGGTFNDGEVPEITIDGGIFP